MNRHGKPLDLAFYSAVNSPLDLDEVTQMKLYDHQSLAAPSPKKAALSSEGRPLIDVIMPQPKSFHAFVPSQKSRKAGAKASTRIRRTRKKAGK